MFGFKRVRDLHYNLLIKISAHLKKEKGNSLGIGGRRDIWDCGVLNGRDLSILGDRQDINQRIFNRLRQELRFTCKKHIWPMGGGTTQ